MEGEGEEGHTGEEPRSLVLVWRLPIPEEGTGCISFSARLIHEVVGLENTSRREMSHILQQFTQMGPPQYVWCFTSSNSFWKENMPCLL